MVQHKPTPEEQLLKLIEGGPGVTKAQGSQEPGAGKNPGSKGSRLSSLKKLPGFITYFKRSFSKKPAWGNHALEIKTVNRLLMFLVAASVIYLGLDVIFFRPDQSKILAQISTSDAVFPLMNTVPEKISADLAVYKASAQRRNPFLPPQTSIIASSADSGPAGEIPTALGSGTMAEKLQGVKLVGISWGEHPLAMIEDVATGRTHFVRKDQEVKGMKVQDIGKDKVILTFEGQEGELF